MANALAPILSRFERLIPRPVSRRAVAFYALYTAGLFLLFLVLTFPHDLVARRTAGEIARVNGWQLRFDDVWLVPWDGYRFANLRVLPADEPVEPWVDAQRLTLRPSPSALFGRGFSGGSFHGEAYGGEFTGSVRVGESTAFELSWRDLGLGRYPRITVLAEGRWGGTMSGALRLQTRESMRDAEGTAKLSLRDGSLVGGNAKGFTIPDLTATNGDGEFDIKGGRIEIRTLKLSGPELDADIRGQVYLRNPLSESVINGTMTVKPVPGSSRGVDALLTLLNRGQKPPSGTYTLTLYGMLSRIRIR